MRHIIVKDTMKNKLTFPAIATLETKDLILRAICPDDAEAYFALCSDLEVMKTWGTEPHQSIEDTRKLIAFLEEAHASEVMIRWAITVKGSDRLVGDVGFWRFVKERSRAEVGAKLAKVYWSGGFMTQALGAVVQFGFEQMNLHSVEANVDPVNRGALRLVEKVGFVQEGLIREHSYDGFAGKFVDTALFSILSPRRPV